MDIKHQKQESNAIPMSRDVKMLLEIGASYIAPVFFGQAKDTGSIHNGTIFFADFGQGILGITAAHVYKGYVDKKDNPNFICQIGNLRFDPEENLIDVDYTLDIATFRINRNLITLLNKQVHNPLNWPAKFMPKQGDSVFLAGYPAAYIIRSQPNNVNFGSTMHMLIIESVNDRYISCKYSETTHIMLDLKVTPKIFYGGISGAPLMLIHENPIFHWSLCGVVYEASTEYEILFASYAHYIQSNGALNKSDY